MRLAIIISFVGLLILEGQGQPSDKQYIFSQNDEAHLEGLKNNALRFTPSISEVNVADSLTEIHIKENRNDYPWTGEISDYKSYYRQYVGYLNEKNEKIIFINSFCMRNENWTKYVVRAAGGGRCFFEIKINLDTNDTFNFYVNAPR